MALSILFYAAGYLTGLLVFVWMARRRRLATTGVYSIAAAALIGGLLAANVTQWLVTGTPGKTVLGAIAGGWLTAILAKRFIGLKRPLGDLFAVAFSAGEAVGRWGCFFGGCCYGKPAAVAWTVQQHGALRHPTQIYLSLASLLIQAVLLFYERTRPPENALFYLQGLLYCAARFGIEFFRETPASLAGLTIAQAACLLGMFLFGAKLYALKTLPAKAPEQAA